MLYRAITARKCTIHGTCSLVEFFVVKGEIKCFPCKCTLNSSYNKQLLPLTQEKIAKIYATDGIWEVIT